MSETRNFEDIEAFYMKQANQTPENYEKETKELQQAIAKKEAEQYCPIIKYYPEWVKSYEVQRENLKYISPLRIGLPLLDKKIQIYGKKVVMIIARSEFGKSSFMTQMIRTQITDDKRVLLFQCEEAGENYVSRFSIFPELQENLTFNFYMSDKSNITIEDIKLTAMQLDNNGLNPDVIYIDQLNKITIPNFKGTKHERIVSISEQLQGLVKFLGRPIVVLHQANRATEQNEGFMTPGNISDADSVYNEAQLCLFIESADYQKWCKTKNPYRDVFEYHINVAKNRDLGGWKGAEFCYFDRSKGIFLSEEQYNSRTAFLN